MPRLIGRGEEGDLMTSSAAAAAARATAAWRLFQGEADVKQVRPSILRQMPQKYHGNPRSKHLNKDFMTH